MSRVSQVNSKRFSLDVEKTRIGKAGEDSFKMDRVIGYGSSEVSTFGHEPLASKIASLCEELKILLSNHQNGVDPRLEISTDTRDTLVTWLLGDPRGSPVTNQLQKDRETLLQQVQTLERKLEVCQSENESLKTSLIENHKKVSGSHIELQFTDHHRANSASALQCQEDSVPHQPSVLSHNSSASLPQYYNKTSSPIVGNGNLKRNRSFRDSFRKAFNRKKRNSKDFSVENDKSLKPLNARAQHFNSLNGPDLADWMKSVGLEMYGELISQLVGTGERLSSIASNTEDLMRLGVLNILHCKKLKLAVENAVAEIPGPLSKLDHQWVADWLKDVGLPQYQQSFMDARIDGQMLNVLSLEDLDFLKIDHPFHITSLRRAIQAFRMCGFDPNYLKTGQEKGSYKLFHWSVFHLMDWMREIELDDYAIALQETGINGPVVALESTLTHESIAKAVGISLNKGLIITHLGEKFVNIIGPIFAQRKVDMMQNKHFVPLDVTMEAPIKGKSRSKLGKKSKLNQQKENYLCPLDEIFPVIPKSSKSVSYCSSSLRGGTTTSYRSATEYNSTVSSDNRRSFVYSPQDQILSDSPPPPPSGISSSVNLSHGASTSLSVITPIVGPPPPPPPPLPPTSNGF